MKKILMLGGSHFQIPAIKYAKSAGYYVITADYLPDNPGHIYADEYYNISTTDKKAILNLAIRLKIDGILSYASDPGAPVAAYVAEKLKLAGNPHRSVEILQRKDLFREFLELHGFNVPANDSFENVKEARIFAEKLLKDDPIIVKPVDSSGSKGVSKLDSIDDFEDSFKLAIDYSFSKKVMVEQFITKTIYEMDGDGFVWNKKLLFRCFGNQHNDLNCNPYVPAGISFPYIQDDKIQCKAHDIIENILSKLEMKVGGLNIEYLTDNRDNIYILEIGPRNGGNLIPEVIQYSTNINLIKYAVEGAMGVDCSEIEMVETKGFYASYILHAKKDGIINEIVIVEEIKRHIVESNVFCKCGDLAKKFNGSNETLGTFILSFDNEIQMLNMMDDMSSYIYIDN